MEPALHLFEEILGKSSRNDSQQQLPFRRSDVANSELWGDNQTIMSQSNVRSPSQPRPIPVIGIVGGIGSGKSAVAKKLAELVPCAVIDADRVGHQVLELPDVKQRLCTRFGRDIFDDQGNVIRKELAARVFGNTPEAIAGRADLDQIVHPEIGRLVKAQIDQHQAARDVRWIILDAAVQLEAKWGTPTDAVVFVDVSDERRWDRVRQRGWTREDWERREASQWPLDRKRAEADWVITNEGTLIDAARELESKLVEQFPGE